MRTLTRIAGCLGLTLALGTAGLIAQAKSVCVTKPSCDAKSSCDAKPSGDAKPAAAAVASSRLTLDKARSIVRTVRRTPCGQQAPGVLCNRLDWVPDLEVAQRLVADLRECASEAAAAQLLFQADAAHHTLMASGDALTREKALAIVKTVRLTPCGQQAPGVLCNQLSWIRDLDVAGKFVVALREAKDDKAAVTLLLEADRRRRGIEKLDAAKARMLANACRTGECAIQAKTMLAAELEDHGDAIGLDKAELLVAGMREAASLAAATELLLRAVENEGVAPPKNVLAGTLSIAGLYASTSEKRVAEGFVPYEVNSPLWSDGASKHRFLRVPAGKKIGFRADGSWDFPTGTTFLQELFVPDGKTKRWIETRVIVQGKRGLHFASYVWNDEQTDALRAVDGDEFFVNYADSSQLWKVVPQQKCTKCHSGAAGPILGVRTEQLNRKRKGAELNQLHELVERGVLDRAPNDTSQLPCLADPYDESKSLDARARSYLHTNCSACHQPGGAGSGTLDLRTTTALRATGTVHPRQEGRRRTVVPGKPHASSLLERMLSVDWDRMPSLQSTVQDERAVELLTKWVRSLPEREGERTKEKAVHTKAASRDSR